MGQQQLLLVILVTIIVGIATVVAINTFSSASDSANVDAVRSDLLSMASSAQQIYMKPEALGGGGQSFNGTTMNDLAFPGEVTDTGAGNNQNGNYQFGAGASSSIGDVQNFVIYGQPATAGGSIAILVCPDDAVMGDYAPDASSITGATAPSSCPSS